MRQNQLRALVAVADNGGIRGAARALFLSQAAVTKALRELESDLGVSLLERTSRGTMLTDYGTTLCARARLIMREMERARQEIHQMRGDTGGSLAVSVSPLESLTVLPAAHEAFRRRMPEVRLTYFEGVLSMALQKLRDGTIDVVVATATPERLNPEFAAFALSSSRLAVVARPGHPRRDARSLAELADEEWILNNVWEGYGQVLLEAFMTEGVSPPARIIGCHSFVTELGMVAATDVITVLPEPLLDIDWVRKSVAPIVRQVELPPVQKSIIVRRDVPPTPAAKLFIDCLQAAYGRRAGP